MSQPVAGVDIANLALDLLANLTSASIVNPADATSDIMARWYDQIRRLLLRKYIFNFARKVVLLTPSANAPTHPEFTNGYALPIDLVRMLKLGDRLLYGGAIPSMFYDFSAGFLYCDDLTDSGLTGITAPTLTVTGISRSGDVYAGVTVPIGSTVIFVQGGTPIPGAQYQLSGLVGSVQANGNVYTIAAGLLGSNTVYFLQTAGGQNFDSSAWGVYAGGGSAAAVYVPPGQAGQPSGLQLTYMFDAQNVIQFDPAFIDLLACMLAARACKKVTGKEPSDKLLSELRNAEVAAAAISGQEMPPRRVQRSRIRAVRQAGGIYRNNTILGGW